MIYYNLRILFEYYQLYQIVLVYNLYLMVNSLMKSRAELMLRPNLNRS